MTIWGWASSHAFVSMETVIPVQPQQMRHRSWGLGADSRFLTADGCQTAIWEMRNYIANEKTIGSDSIILTTVDSPVYIFAFCVLSRSPRYDIKRYKRKESFFLYVLLTEAAWILTSNRRNGVVRTYVARWLSVTPRVVLHGRKHRCGMHIDASEVLKPFVDYAPF